MSRWFRHYAGMMRDDKLVRVALRAKQPVERVVWIWGAILESAAEIDDGGRFDLEAAEAAYFLRADEADILSVLDGLEAMGRVREGFVVKWGDRQFQSDRSAERQRRLREKRGRVTSPSADSDAHVTAPSRHGDAPETETETESSEASASGAVAPIEPSDPVERIWFSGVPLLVEMGIPEAKARRQIGLWLKFHDPTTTLDAIQRSRDMGSRDPIPLVTRILQNVNVRGKNGKAQSVQDVARSLESRFFGPDATH